MNKEDLVVGRTYRVRKNHLHCPNKVGRFEFLGGPENYNAVLSIENDPHTLFVVAPDHLEEVYSYKYTPLHSLAEWLHKEFCPKKHWADECLFAVECNDWNKETHKYWLKQAEQVKDKLNEYIAEEPITWVR